MKRSLTFSLIGFIFTAPVCAEVALVYKSNDDVKKAVFAQGVATSQGIVVSASGLLAAGDKITVGMLGRDLLKASLVRFDNDLNFALLRTGERVEDAALQAAHKKTAEKVSLFLPELGHAQTVNSAAGSTSAAPVSPDAEKFLIKLNGIAAGAEPVVIKKRRKKADVTIELVGQNIEPAWRIAFTMSANPTLSFWKKADTRGLNSIPSKTLSFSHQVLMRQFTNGSSIAVPVEISSIKEENYELTMKVDYKAGTYETKIPVRFAEE